jgi:hypothetical protein
MGPFATVGQFPSRLRERKSTHTSPLTDPLRVGGAPSYAKEVVWGLFLRGWC